MAALRAETQAQHDRLDSQLPIAGSHPTFADYRQHLLVLRAWLGPLQQWLGQFDDGPQDPDFLPPTARLALIEADLADPSLAPADRHPYLHEHRHQLPFGAPASDAAAYRWGVCYVIDGSQLGGTVLYRRLAATLSPHPLRYLSADNVAPGPRWTAFLHGLRAAVREPAAIAAACDGARDAFDRILALHGLDARLDAGQAA
ncbi:biliverdin-producing heme oxygenase [Rugamonas sp.]|uniref:biliverdin-producing heme oxygenase n=1 Tax=Rugamonas sp. TaxID=1926287 RepID=UPI0025DCCE26|nr:biliverdin-producing heme oxygenase [Rugamonas sp.]